jgi:hypothetical protein
MKAARFDTLDYAKQAKNAGFTEEQAEFQAKALESLAELLNEDLATKSDIKEVKNDIKEVRNELKNDIKDVRHELIEVRNELKNDIKDLRHELQSFIVKSLITTIGVLTALQGLMHYFFK